MTEIPFSIIIPVYNDEDNISRCLESVLSQTFIFFECLIIDDGSTDLTYDVCNNKINNDSRFYIYKKENEGISKTRQFGINNSRGLYTIFIDSDDWIEFDFLEKINKKILDEMYDIYFISFFNEEISSKEKLHYRIPSSLTSESVVREVLECKLFSCLWNVIIKKNIYDKKISFNNKINYGEDTLFILEILLNNPSIGYLEGAFYHHTFNSNSYTRINLKKRFYERIKFLLEIEILLNNYYREDLKLNNFFPFNDKYIMLSSGIFSSDEYHSLFCLNFSEYFRRESNSIKYILLLIAETKFYSLAKYFSILIKKLIN